jgi:hypothetical protein
MSNQACICVRLWPEVNLEDSIVPGLIIYTFCDFSAEGTVGAVGAGFDSLITSGILLLSVEEEGAFYMRQWNLRSGLAKLQSLTL